MTVVIGSQTDVPTTGDPIVSPWYQDTARKLVHTFANATARNAWTTRPDGAVAITTNDDLMWQWNGSAWVAIAADRVAKAGDTMSGPLIVGANPSSAAGVSALPSGSTQNSNYTAGAPCATLNLVDSAAATNEKFMLFRRTSAYTAIGSITIASSTTVAYATTSDPRTKTPPPATRDIGDAAARAQQLGRLAWQGHHIDPDSGQPEGGHLWDFLSSHDVEDVAPYAVTGERDACDDDGNPIWQQVSFADLVPLLFAALANALDRIDALEGAAS